MKSVMAQQVGMMKKTNPATIVFAAPSQLVLTVSVGSGWSSPFYKQKVHNNKQLSQNVERPGRRAGSGVIIFIFIIIREAGPKVFSSVRNSLTQHTHTRAHMHAHTHTACSKY